MNKGEFLKVMGEKANGSAAQAKIYYDAFVKKSEIPTIWAAVSPEVSINLSENTKTATVGNGFSLEVSAFSPPNVEERMAYQWYIATNPDLSDAKKINYATAAMFEDNLTRTIEPGVYYVFARVLVNGLNYLDSEPCVVTIQ